MNTLASRTAVCVGATSGLGQHAALELARRGMNVVVVGRDKARADAVTAEVRRLCPNGDHRTVLVDAFSIESVKSCCAAISSIVAEGRSKQQNGGAGNGVPNNFIRGINYLILSQGMATTQGFTPTPDGFDQKMALHFYSRMLFTALLKEDLLATAKGQQPSSSPSPSAGAFQDVRVISILSGGVHKPYQGLLGGDPTLEKSYSVANAANAAGYYTDLAFDYFARKDFEDRHQLPAAIAYIHHAPGFVATNWGTEMPWFIKGPVRALQCVAGRSANDWAKEFVEKTVLGSEFSAPPQSCGEGEGTAMVLISKQNSRGDTTGAEHHTSAAREAVRSLVMKPYFDKAGVLLH